MSPRTLLSGLAAVLSSAALLHAQTLPNGVVGWYNGDWQSGIPSQSAFYVSTQSFSRVYDDFVVPDGGWTVTGVFGHYSMTSAGVTSAAWEIRSGVSAGNGGTVIASGISLATQSVAVNGGQIYLMSVTGLFIHLDPGRYWISVAPATSQGSWVNPTLGGNAIGSPNGKNAGAFLYDPSHFFVPEQASGGGGTSSDFSQGVLITWVNRDLAWMINITSFAQQIETFEQIPFDGVSVEDFDSAVEQLISQVPVLSDAGIRTAMQELVASIGVAHTDIGWPPGTFQFLPLSFYWFDDGIYVTGATSAYQNLIGGQLVSIGNSPVDDATSRLTPLVAYDNPSCLKYNMMNNKITNTDFLFGTGITPDTSGAQIQVQTASGDLVAANVAAQPNQFPTLISAYRGPLPLYQQNTGKHYWATTIDNGATVYFQYNSCTEDPNQSSSSFLASLNQMIASSSVQRLIVDMRNNTGGQASILNPWIEQIRNSRFNATGGLYVIVGRATFSAAMEASDHFRDETAAIFVGEPSGAKPQFVYRVGAFNLPFFGMSSSYSARNETAKDPGPALVPDILTPVTFQNFMSGKDPAMDAILALPLP